ncbi:hypothetical protein EKK58_00930 [Candidatus Dependentiae bacterium]|nr:MAG: hypothetical protein EKK58_00930 [Candidatus Dependentiae bacterium]
MPKTIHTAIAHLSPRLQAHLLDQWARCETVDIYDGDLDKYLTVIEQEMQAAFDALLQTAAILEAVQTTINGLTPERHGAAKPEKVVFQIRERRVFYLPENIEEFRGLTPEG